MVEEMNSILFGHRISLQGMRWGISSVSPSSPEMRKKQISTLLRSRTIIPGTEEFL